MAIRHWRFMGGRTVNKSEAKALVVIPLFKFEEPMSMELYWRCMSVNAGTRTPTQPLEYNMDVIALPWHLCEGFEALTGSVSTTSSIIANDTDWDDLYEHYAFSIGTDARYYGGEVGSVPSSGSETDESEESSSAESGGFLPNRSILESYPPSDAVSLFRAEPICRIMTAEASNQVRWGDEGRIVIDCSPATFGAQGGALIIGFRRYAPNDSPNDDFGINISSQLRPVFEQLKSGMVKLIVERIRDGATDVDDWLRTMLFDGDTNIESNTWEDEDMIFNTKGRVSVQTPYERLTV